jgi:hypothetical protein
MRGVFATSSKIESARKKTRKTQNRRGFGVFENEIRHLAPALQLGLASRTLHPEETTMTSNSNPAIQNIDALPIDLHDLMTAIQDLPTEYRTELEQPLNRVVEYTRRRRRILNLIQEALSQLRMDMKYLMFDLEATRRERDTYKDALEGEI